MNLSVIRSGENVYVSCECIKGYAFKIGDTRDKYAYFDLVTSFPPNHKMI